MKGFENPSYLLLDIISNVAAILLLWAAWKQSRIARLLFFLIFVWAAWTNWSTAHHHPQFYMEYADLTFLGVYNKFIQGWFSDHITAAVSFIAVCQALIAVAMLMKGWVLKTGLIGAIAFLLAIAPLGVGAAFPFSLIAAAALYLIYRNPSDNYLWVSSKNIHTESMNYPFHMKSVNKEA